MIDICIPLISRHLGFSSAKKLMKIEGTGEIHTGRIHTHQKCKNTINEREREREREREEVGGGYR